MKIMITLLALLLIAVPSANAQNKTSENPDMTEIRQLFQSTADAWGSADAVKFADCFTDDVDYTVWNGFRFSGRKANIEGHQQIFGTIYKGTTLQLNIGKIRFLSPTIAIVLYDASMKNSKGEPMPGVPSVRPMAVVQKLNEKWLIAAFQNTPVIERGELVIGRKPAQTK